MIKQVRKSLIPFHDHKIIRNILTFQAAPDEACYLPDQNFLTNRYEFFPT